jgi:hypothetical protein
MEEGKVGEDSDRYAILGLGGGVGTRGTEGGVSGNMRKKIYSIEKLEEEGVGRMDVTHQKVKSREMRIR